MRKWNLANVVLLLCLQTPTLDSREVSDPTLAVTRYFGDAARQEIFVAATNFGGQMRTVLVLHAREKEEEMPDADIQVWPSGRVKLKNAADLDGNSRKFWYALALVSEQTKRDICR